MNDPKETVPWLLESFDLHNLLSEMAESAFALSVAPWQTMKGTVYWLHRANVLRLAASSIPKEENDG